ncbi:hypothetical protein J6590_025177 [Homalodisca vitripennis]|nr:hypothetical protein J6590_025177 [Homalodisca vitripennis]
MQSDNTDGVHLHSHLPNTLKRRLSESRSSETSVNLLLVTADTELPLEGSHGYGYSERQGRHVEAETPLLNSRHAPRQGPVGGNYAREGSSRHEERDGDSFSAGSVNDLKYNQQSLEQPIEDSATDASSSYSTMVLHSRPERQKVSSNSHYQTTRKKPLKNYPKGVRHNGRKSPLNQKQHKNIKQADPPPHYNQQQPTPSSIAQGDPFVQAVHPAIMQKLLKQQPQTFDDPQQKESEELSQVPSDWPGHEDKSNINTDHQSFNPHKPRTNLQQGIESSGAGHDVINRPIYVPNRVSVQNPSSDSLFNVGYSIGFGNGIFQRPKAGLVDPPVGVRQGKGISHPISYQNTPVNLHIDGMNSVWKNMGSGVEISHNVNTNYKTVKPLRDETENDQNEKHSGSVLHQPIFVKEGIDQSFNSVSTIGRNSFDHNHALQHSNSFDFSNAINPATNQPYSSPEGLVQFVGQPHPSYEDSFPKQTVPTSIETKQPHPSYSESFLKHPYPTYVEPQTHQKQETYNPVQSHFTKPDNGGKFKYDDLKYETPKYERPGYGSDSPVPFRPQNSISFSPKPKAIDFSKVPLTNLKQSYTAYKPFLNGDVNYNSQDNFGNSFGFHGLQGLPQYYNPPIKSPHGGMVQAILVPVNTPAPSFSYPINIPVMGSGYSPYIGHPLGMISVPESSQGERPAIKSGYEPTNAESYSPPDAQQFLSAYKKTPKQLHSHNSVVKHQPESNNPSEPSQFSQFHRSKHAIHRAEEPEDPHHPINYKRVFTTEAPDHSTSEVKSHSSPIYSHPSDYVSSPSSHYPVNSHHPRIYRRPPMILVKRA